MLVRGACRGAENGRDKGSHEIVGTMDSDPHGHKRQRKDQTIIAQSALDLIGDTPIVKINHIGADENLRYAGFISFIRWEP